MRVKLPRGRSLEGGLLTAFESERDRIDAMMASRNAPKVAQNQPIAAAPANRVPSLPPISSTVRARAR